MMTNLTKRLQSLKQNICYVTFKRIHLVEKTTIDMSYSSKGG